LTNKANKGTEQMLLSRVRFFQNLKQKKSDFEQEQLELQNRREKIKIE
jgi:hypothetical protein